MSVRLQAGLGRTLVRGGNLALHLIHKLLNFGADFLRVLPPDERTAQHHLGRTVGYHGQVEAALRLKSREEVAETLLVKKLP